MGGLLNTSQHVMLVLTVTVALTICLPMTAWFLKGSDGKERWETIWAGNRTSTETVRDDEKKGRDVRKPSKPENLHKIRTEDDICPTCESLILHRVKNRCLGKTLPGAEHVRQCMWN